MWGQAIRFAISPSMQIAGAALSAVAVVLASRDGQLSDIAAFAAGSAVAGIAAVVAGGGTSLLFVTGSRLEQQAVRWVRWRLTAPAMIASCCVIDLVVSHLGGISWASMLLGSSAVILQCLAALEAAVLQRERRMTRWGSCVLVSRALPVGMIGLGLQYSVSMAAGPLILLLLLLFATRGSRVTNADIQFGTGWHAVKLAYRPSFSVLSILDATFIRTPFAIASLTTDAVTAGAFAALLTAQQSLGAVFTTSLYTIMTIRGGKLDESLATLYRHIERFAVIASLPVSLLAVAAGPAVARVFGLEALLDFEAIWTWISLSLPLVTLGRCLQYSSMSNRQEARAIAQLFAVTVGVALMSMGACLTHSIVLLSASTLIGEALGIVTWLLITLWQSPRNPKAHKQSRARRSNTIE